MKPRAQLLMSCGAVLALSACGGNGVQVTQTPVTQTPLLTDDVGTAAEALAAGETLTAQGGSSAAINLNYETGDTDLTGAIFEVSKNEAGELTMVLNGVEQVFSPDDRRIEIGGEVYGYQIENDIDAIYVSLWSWRGEVPDTLDPANPRNLQVWEYYSNQIVEGGGEPTLHGWAVVGTGTDPSVLGALPTASYFGRATMDIYPATGFDNSSATRLRAELNINADFGAGLISGELYNFIAEEPIGNVEGEVNVAGTVSMDETDIIGNGFAGSLTGNEAFNADSGIIDATGTYSGNFYGSEAEEVGGVMTLTGTNGDGEFNGVGFFAGDIDD